MKYEFFADAGHGWLKVKFRELVDLGIHEAISPYSYKRGDYVYLEEDCDAPKFIKAKSDKIEYRVRYSANSRIRNYQHYFIG